MLHVGPIIVMVVLPGWSFIFSGSLVQVKIETSSLTPEHIINSGELQFLSDYRWIGNC
jgi:hypothetical protein